MRNHMTEKGKTRSIRDILSDVPFSVMWFRIRYGVATDSSSRENKVNTWHTIWREITCHWIKITRTRMHALPPSHTCTHTIKHTHIHIHIYTHLWYKGWCTQSCVRRRSLCTHRDLRWFLQICPNARRARALWAYRYYDVFSWWYSM